MNEIHPASSKFLAANINVSKRADGSLILSSADALEPYANSLGDYLRKWAIAAPEMTFLAQRDDAGDWHRFSYRQVFTAAQSISEALLTRGLGLEQPLMVLSGNSLNFARIMLGAMLVGIPVVPVSPAYSLVSRGFEKLKHIYASIRPGLIYVEDLKPFEAALSALDLEGIEIVATKSADAKIRATSFTELLAYTITTKVQAAVEEVGPDTIAKILFTSGSTGMPKGVINTQRMLCSNQQAIMQLWPFLQQSPPVIVDWLPWNHTFGGCHNFNMILCNGGTLYIDEGKPLPGLIKKTIENLRDIAPTLYFNVPAGYDALLPYLEADDKLCRHFFSKLELLMYAAASLPQGIWDRLEKLSLAVLGRKIPMLAAWGTTETAPMATVTYKSTRRAGAIGLPIPGTEIKMVPYEGKFELRVKGPNITPGYWCQPGQTAEIFDDEGYYLPGDAGTFASKDNPAAGILFSGRIAEEFKLDTGTWVSVGNLRVAVIEACAPLVQDAVVCGHDRHEIGLLIIPNVNGCRSLFSDLAAETSIELLIKHDGFRARLVEKLEQYNAANQAGSTRIDRVLFLTAPLSIDACEITDKGYINQRGVLNNHADAVERLFTDDPAVIRLNH